MADSICIGDRNHSFNVHNCRANDQNANLNPKPNSFSKDKGKSNRFMNKKKQRHKRHPSSLNRTLSCRPVDQTRHVRREDLFAKKATKGAS